MSDLTCSGLAGSSPECRPQDWRPHTAPPTLFLPAFSSWFYEKGSFFQHTSAHPPTAASLRLSSVVCTEQKRAAGRSPLTACPPALGSARLESLKACGRVKPGCHPTRTSWLLLFSPAQPGTWSSPSLAALQPVMFTQGEGLEDELREGWPDKPMSLPPARLLGSAWAGTAGRTSWRESRTCEKHLRRSQRARGSCLSSKGLLPSVGSCEALHEVVVCLCKGRICSIQGECTGEPLLAVAPSVPFRPFRMSYDPAEEKLGGGLLTWVPT